jgi:hypothetical protein
MGHKSVNHVFFSSWKLAELFTRIRSPYIWQTRKRANAPDIVNGNCLQQMKGPWHRLSRVHRDILIFTSSALKTWVLHVSLQVDQRSNTQIGQRVLSDFTPTNVRQMSDQIVRPNPPMKGPWHRLSRVHRDILIFTSSALKTWVLHVNTFYSWISLYISPVTAVNISILSVPLYITHLLVNRKRPQILLTNKFVHKETCVS